MIYSEEVSFREVKILLLFLSLVAILIQYRNFGFLSANELLADRLIYNQGKGYLQFLNFASYFLVFYGIKQYLADELPLTHLLLFTIPALAIFTLKLQRGHAVYPLFFVFLAFAYKKLPRKTAHVLTAVAIFSMFFIGNITSAIRTSIVSNNDQLEYAFSKESIIPMSFSHAELLTAIISDESIQYMPNTLWGSFVNWIPSFIYHNKPLTTGPILNWKYANDAGLDLNRHRSSYTTDLLIEGYYNWGYVGIFVFGFIYSLIIGFVWKKITRMRYDGFLWFPISLFVLGFTIYFTDLGNFLGFIVIFLVDFLFVKFYASIVNKRR